MSVALPSAPVRSCTLDGYWRGKNRFGWERLFLLADGTVWMQPEGAKSASPYTGCLSPWTRVVKADGTRLVEG